MTNFVDNYCEFPIVMRRPMWRIWHNLLIRFVKDSSVNFMNYGYSSLNGDTPIYLEKNDEANRYCIQLYDHVASGIKLENKKVVEIGSGRGGGAHFIARYHKPSKYTGIDISPGVIKYCNSEYKVPGLSFLEGKAEKIPLESESQDAVVNVESARCYSDLNVFFKEVYRILNKSGHFLFADMIEKQEVIHIREKLRKNGFIILSEKEITKNVAKGLQLDSKRRENLIEERIPGILKKSFARFAGTEGTERFNSFHNGKFEYWSFVLAKNQAIPS
ncbi:MAG: class I SAM-dependent methyltransferase [Bacteroidales bacterium]|nr:class I SAM-dependent methyltransferase [Bacteroidales bacterium]MCF8391091.1 class I SAM-dependent methyltransferase [Bacteroidales bacterium]